MLTFSTTSPTSNFSLAYLSELSLLKIDPKVHLSTNFLHFNFISVNRFEHLFVVFEQLTVILPALDLRPLLRGFGTVGLDIAVFLLDLLQQLLLM